MPASARAAELLAAEPDWLRERRRDAASAAEELALPGPKTPGWEFTDLSGLRAEGLVPAEGGDADAYERARPALARPPGGPTVRQVDALALDAAAGDSGDGRGDGATPQRPDRPLVMPLAEAAARYPELVRERLGSLVARSDPFAARNEAAWRGGAFVYVPANARLEAPARISIVQAEAGSALAFRSLIVLEEGAEAEVWEQWLSVDGEQAESLFNAVTEISVGAAARLRYVSAQQLSPGSWVFGTQRAEVGRDASLDWVALGFGSARGKVRMETKLAGEGSSARVTGAYAGTDSQHLDYDTTQEHAAAHTTSDLAFRGVLGGRATAVWRGMIRVDPGAQRTDAFQESRNLLLSRTAHADAIPGLEIEANDVRCTHAAAVAQIDREQLHYLRAHGLPEAEATRLIIEGFLEALVERLDEGAAAGAVSAALERRLTEVLGA